MPDGTAPAAPGPTGHRIWKRSRVIAVVAAGVLLLAACGVGLYLMVRTPADTDETRIRTLVEDFAAAVDRDEQSTILKLLCSSEAQEITQDDDFDPSRPPPSPQPSVRPVEVAEIRVENDTASARVTRPAQSAVRLYFRKEKGTWKVCAPAGDANRPTAGPTDSR
ncbi:hypothetical protein ABT063_50565 [Streptomyces sp. NPDC002838]|uniref:Rv0361 family membrane protein n=1 Tax=Streptomyces sp. NPDC002838 TaxID=3154436 RepID=UPI00331B10C3